MNDRTIGYLCISLSVITVIVSTVFLITRSAGPAETRVIEFPDIAGLSFINKDDPVTLKGMVIGKVLSAELRNGKVFVTIYSNRHIAIHSDYSVSIGAQGVMGNRFLNIDPGLLHSEITKEHHLKGTILPSPPEAIAEMKTLIAAIQELNNLSDVLLYGDSTGESFVSRFRRTTGTADTLSSTFLQKSRLAAENVTKIMDTLNSLITQCTDIKKRLARQMSPTLDSINVIVWTGFQIIEQVDSVLNKTGYAIKKYSNQDFSSLDESIGSIQNGLCSLSVMLNSIHEKGFFFPVRLK
jgi:ABC-type transporter Mla subunit MlaD